VATEIDPAEVAVVLEAAPSDPSPREPWGVSSTSPVGEGSWGEELNLPDPTLPLGHGGDELLQDDESGKRFREQRSRLEAAPERSPL
jgi:hypothetical protein